MCQILSLKHSLNIIQIMIVMWRNGFGKFQTLSKLYFTKFSSLLQCLHLMLCWCDHLTCQLHLQNFLFIEVLTLSLICTIKFYEESIPQSIASISQSPSFNYTWLPCFHLHLPMKRPLVISRKSLPTLITKLLN